MHQHMQPNVKKKKNKNWSKHLRKCM